MKRLLVAPDSLGGWLSAVEFCERVRAGTRELDGIELLLHPMADGGEGTLEVLRYHLGGSIQKHSVSGPLAERRVVSTLQWDSEVFLESALAIGLTAGHGSGEPIRSSTRGLGEWMRAESGRSMCIGLGGSSTVDGGIGMLRGLGFEVLNTSGRPVVPGAAGLMDARQIVGEGPERLDAEIWSDVRTSLSQSVIRYGPQKGLRVEDVPQIQSAMMAWGDCLLEFGTRRGLSEVSIELEGGGAAGGLGFALAAALGAELRTGFDVLSERSGLSTQMSAADWVLCAEGQLDAGSFEGKPLGEIARMARCANVQVLAMVGRSINAPAPPQGPDSIIEIGWLPTPDKAFEQALLRLKKVLSW